MRRHDLREEAGFSRPTSCRISGVLAEIDADLVPVADVNRLDTCLTGGDDHQLAFARSPTRHGKWPVSGWSRFYEASSNGWAR